MSDAFYAATLPIRSAWLIARKPRVLVWAAFPAALTLVLYYFVLGGILDFLILTVQGWLVAWGASAAGWLASITLFTIKVAIFLVAALTFSYLATLFASPLNDFLAETVERYTALAPTPPTGWREKLRLFRIDATKTVASLVLSIFLLLCSWIPVIGIAATALLAMLTAFQYLSYPQTRRGISLLEGLKFVAAHPLPSVAFGFVTVFLFAIPFFAWIALPLAVVGGTLLYARLSARLAAPPPAPRLPR